MALIYINPRFPKSKRAYAKAGDDNTDRLKQVMEKLLIAESKPTPTKSGGFIQTAQTKQAWSYSDRKKAAKTFKL